MNPLEFKDCFDIASAYFLLSPSVVIKALERASGPQE